MIWARAKRDPTDGFQPTAPPRENARRALFEPEIAFDAQDRLSVAPAVNAEPH
jgi:hypothetical protein